MICSAADNSITTFCSEDQTLSDSPGNTYIDWKQ